jgi:hypothetical protein
MPITFLAILEESAVAAIPATAEAMQKVSAHLEKVHAQWNTQATHLSVEELAKFRQRLGKLSLLVDHAARRRFGLARHTQAMESGYTANGLPPRPAATSWECTG